MQVGLFGKLPAKGDFVSRGVPPEILQHWEVWLEKVVGGAKHHLGAQWQDIYGQAPVWRFWVGEMVYGHPFSGALIPSMDRVGRRFPLTLVHNGAGGAQPAPPVAGTGNEPFYDALQSALTLCLGEGFDGDIDGLLHSLPMPQGTGQAKAEDRRHAFFAYGEDGMAPMLADVRDHDHQLAAVGRSYWWTAGNAHTGPAIVALNGMPDAAGFAALLGGFGPPAIAADPIAPEPEVAWGDDPQNDLSWAAPVAPTPRTMPPTAHSEIWSDEDAPVDSPFDTETGWTVPSPDAINDTPQPQDDVEETDAVDEPDTATDTSDVAKDSAKAETDAEPEPEPDPIPEQADLSIHGDEEESDEDHASPFGLPEDAENAATAKKGPSLRGLFSLKGRRTAPKD